MTQEHKYTKAVAIYIRGKDLDPDAVTRALGANPSFYRKKGERCVPSAGSRSAIVKVGVWRLSIETDSGPLSGDIEKLLSIVSVNTNVIGGIKGVEEPFIDVFVATSIHGYRGGALSVTISKENVSSIAKTGLPFFMTICLTKK